MDHLLRSPIAQVVFGEEVDADRSVKEQRLVDVFCRWVDRVGRAELHQFAVAIDTNVIPYLSAPNVLRIAQLLDARAPEVLQNMRLLTGHLDVLQIAERAGGFFGRGNLQSLRAALMSEGDN